MIIAEDDLAVAGVEDIGLGIGQDGCGQRERGEGSGSSADHGKLLLGVIGGSYIQRYEATARKDKASQAHRPRAPAHQGITFPWGAQAICTTPGPLAGARSVSPGSVD
ncbi:hypothetical protein JANAI62_35380 [Jannaschia pagri]|uniref:Uncharacterized protein n=1 Tax=Jannaschia pagri TaxID=2829797 RepID=A0ABQ4NRK4_9RHOB|nr:hypothetical protein JANAI61_35380 [Jannaschia sp. AI_61]GIT96915.1 hypothetical protein JANAI62_35380 [Jannaschia sp. AI_62]